MAAPWRGDFLVVDQHLEVWHVCFWQILFSNSGPGCQALQTIPLAELAVGLPVHGSRVQHHDAVFANRRQGELKAGAARQAANRIAPRQKSKSLLDISNPSKRRSTDHEIVAPSFWEYPSRTEPPQRQCGAALTHSARWTFGRIFGLDRRESYRELRLELLCCPHRLSRGCSA